MSPVPEPGSLPSDIREQLRPQWHALCRAYVADSDLIEEVLAMLARRYGEDGRFYHTLAHVGKVLHTIHMLEENPSPSLQFAAWFHDAIYDPRRQNNEARSARLAAEQLSRLRVPVDLPARVRTLIMVTHSHQPAPDDLEAMVLVDADLAILGAETAVYEQYARAIRQEYAHVPDAAYRYGRQQVLRQFLERPNIYWTAVAARNLEALARTNLKMELAQLAS